MLNSSSQHCNEMFHFIINLLSTHVLILTMFFNDDGDDDDDDDDNDA